MPPIASDARNLDDVLAACMRAFETGAEVDRHELLERFPQWATDLREFFAANDEMQALAGALRVGHQALADTAQPGERLRYVGDYELVEQIGRGGMGVVYRARQLSLDRQVAVKMIVDPDHDRERFRVEAEAAALLHHPNIITIFEVGEFERWPYYSMQLVDGGDLREVMMGNVSEREAARLTAQLARAVQYAHTCGVLHRDLKPANVLLDFDGLPLITDFGLAKLLDKETHLTKSGATLGTPSYMAPEQVSGGSQPVTVATDVYGLGAILYALLAGRAPFEGLSSFDVLRQVEGANPPALRDSRKNLHVDLETVCLKCLEKQPRDRYPTADTLADDLERFLRGEPVAARPIGSLERAWRWCKRNPLVASLCALLLAVLVGSAIGGSTLAVREHRARLAVERSQQQALSNLSDAYVEAAESPRRLRVWSEAVLWYASAAELPVSQEQRDANLARAVRYNKLVAMPKHAAWLPDVEFYKMQFAPSGTYVTCLDAEGALYGWDLATSSAPVRIASESHVNDFAWGADGRVLALATESSGVVLLDGSSLEVLWSGAAAKPVASVSFSANGGRLAAATGAEVTIWHLEAEGLPDGEPTVRIDCGVEVGYVGFSPGGSRLLAQLSDSTANVFDLEPEHSAKSVFPAAVPQNLTADRGKPLHPSFMGDDRLLTAAGTKKILYDLTTGDELSSYNNIRNGVMAINRTGTRAILGGSFSARLWRLDTRRPSFRFRHRDAVLAAQFSPDLIYAATASRDRSIRIWRLRDGYPLMHIPHQHYVSALCYSPDGTTMVTAQVDGLVRAWDVVYDNIVKYFTDIPGNMTFAKLTPDSKGWFLSGGPGKRVALDFFQIHSVQNGEVKGPRLALPGILRDADVSRCERYLATLTTEEVEPPDTGVMESAGATSATETRLRLWQWPSGQKLANVPILDGAPHTVAFHPTRAQVAIGTSAGIAVVDVRSGRLEHMLRLDSGPDAPADAGQGDGLTAASYASDGRFVVGWNERGSIQAWNPESGSPLWEPLDGGPACASLEVSPTAEHLATVHGQEVRIWDASTGALRAKLAHDDHVYNARFAPDGQRLATACADDYARIFDVETGELVERPMGQRNDVFDAQFTHDGRWLLTAADNGMVILRDAHKGRHVMHFALSPSGYTQAGQRTAEMLVPASGGRLITAGNRNNAKLYDMSLLASLGDVDADRLRIESELAAGQIIQNGYIVPLSSAEWMERWREYAAKYVP